MRRYPDMFSIRIMAISCCLIFHGVISMGQQAAVYNINKYNGLSTNHVYCTLVDKLGYLWLGTTDGVYRYNGYALRKYDYNDGLPNVDVWNLYEDSQGRIWLRSIAQHIGYIKNNRYKRVYKNTSNPYLEIYPEPLSETEDGNFFFFNNTTDIKRTYVYCLIENDTLKSQNVFEGKYKTMPQVFGNYTYHTKDSVFYLFNLQKIFSDKSGRYGKPDEKILGDSDITQTLFNKRLNSFIRKFTTYYSPADKTFGFINTKTGKSTNYDVRKIMNNENQQINFCYVNKKYFYCITNDAIIKIDSNLQVKAIYKLDILFPGTPISGYTTTYFDENSLWGKILASSNNGLYLKSDASAYMSPAKANLDGFIFLNNKNDTDGYWWNNIRSELAIVSNGEVKEISKLKGAYGLKKIVHYDTAYDIVISATNTYWMDKHKILIPVNHGIDTAISIDTINYGYSISHGTFIHSNDIFVADNKELYFLGMSTIGSKKIKIDRGNRRLYYSSYHDYRFRNILFNRVSNTLFCYSTDKVFLFNPHSGFRQDINQQQLELLGFNAIEKIAADRYGNIFIKDYNNLKILNYTKGSIRQLLKTYNLRQAKMEVINNELFIAGNFGVLKAKIHPEGRITVINIFHNTKNIYYKYVSDVQFATNSALLKTDNGNFIYYFDNDNSNRTNDYRIIANNSDSLRSISDNDTLAIAQGLSVINLDVIKPTGTGNLRIEYSINKSSYQFSENQLILPVLTPGSYNTVSIIASDDSWRSKPMKFTIYVQPYWWQTQTAKRVIFVLFLLAFIGFVYLVIVMTRRIVNRSNERRTQRRELELKSIYSQINPHFIFNSLSTAQYFVKKNKNKEAFEHINQFSDLLRAYIKSSRAKYITIAEEMENLENYLQLQLTRFEEKFDYNIKIDTSVNPEKVKIPSLLLQPLVENALNHGIFHSDTKGHLNISFQLDEPDNNTLICIVDDNGIGRQKSKELRGKIIRKADSYGTILIKELIDTFNKYEKINIEIEYIDKQLPETGTTVIIRIKNFTHAQ